MHFKSFVSMGVAAVLIVPTLITAANPELAYAKTNTKTSSKKISAKAKAVIAKIKAINPKKSNYVTKTKSAVNAYKKLSSKDKKMVYNYGTLKKHWTTVQNRKAKQVIASIKAINPKKSDYVLKTKSALSAYNKLSKTDKKKVTNYSTLKKHWKNIQPYLKKVDAFNKSVATLSTKNFTTKSVALEKQYDNLDAITKAAVPSTTLKKLSYYSNVVSTKKMVFRTLAVTDPSTSTPTTTEDGTKILTVINAYNKLSGAQKTLLEDLLTANSSATTEEQIKEEKEKETARNNLKRYLAVEDLVKKAADIEKKYAALLPISKAKPQDLVSLYDAYKSVIDIGDSIDSIDKSGNNKIYSISDFLPHGDSIANIYTAYKNEINNSQIFKNLIDNLEAGTDTDPYNTIKNINAPTSVYKKASISINENPLGYPLVAPIDLADKNAVSTYKKYEPVLDVVNGFEDTNLKLPLLSQVTWAGSGVTSPTTLTPDQIAKLVELLPQYNKLGANQKKIVQHELEKGNNYDKNAKGYLSEGKNLTSAQAIDKSYASAIKNSSKPSYFIDLLKVNNAYTTAAPEVKRFVVNASDIDGIPNRQEYKDAKDGVNAFTNEVNKIPTASTADDAVSQIGKATTEYNKISSKPSWLALVDKAILKTYTEYAKVPDVLKLKLPAYPASASYKSKDITNILNAVKEYKKLGTPQKEIVDSKNQAFSSFADDESYIKEAQKIDNAYLKLKKSSNTYPSDAKKVFTSYDDATDDVKKYVANSGEISNLLNTFTTEQQRVSHFEDLVKPLSKKSSVKDVEDAVDYYTYHISPEPKASSLVDKAIMKKYNQYAPISDVVKMFSLINESTVSSPTVTPTDAKYIQKVIKAYNALGPDQQMIVDNENRSKYPFLEDAEEITAAEAIDKAFEKIKPTDDKYEIEVLDVYYNLYDRALPIVKKYVANKETLEEVGDRYGTQLGKAREFETLVTDMSHVSQKGSTPGVLAVRNLEKYYEDNIKYNIINAKYNVALKTLIDPNIMAEYEKYLPILQIQDIAKSIYVQYGKLFNYENNNKKPIGYTDTGKVNGTPIKITNPNDIKSIYKAIEMYNKLESSQRAILDKAPKFLSDHQYEDNFHITYTGDHVEGEVIRPSIPLSDDEIKNFLKAQEIDKAFEALNPSSDSYLTEAVKLYYQFNKAGENVQIYVIHEKEIEDFKTNYNTAKVIAGLDDFVTAVNALSNDSSYDNVKTVVNKYNNLSEAQLALLDKPTLTKYNSYAPIAEIMSLTGQIDSDNDGKYIDSDIDKMLKAITIYKKLSKDPKAIVVSKLINGSDSKYKYLDHEKEIKAAQKVDNAFKKLDKTDDKYVINLKKVETDYVALNDLKLSGFTDKTAKIYVASSANIDEAIGRNIYNDPKTAANNFKKSVDALLDLYPMTYHDVEVLVNQYNLLNSKAKSLVDSNTLKTYNKYSPIVTIVTTLDDIKKVPTEADFQQWANYEKNNSNILESPATGFYKSDNQYDVGTKILNAIQLYNKLGSDQKDIVLNEVLPGKPGGPIPATNPLDTTADPLGKKKLALLNESNNIKAAQALDKKIAAIKPNSTSYAKGVIDANKTLEVMPKEQRVYLINVDTLNTFKIKTQTKKAIDDLAKFENGVKQVDEWTSEIQKDASGNIIPGTCTYKDTNTNSDKTGDCNTLITSKMGGLKTQFDQLNTPRLVDGSEISLASLIDKTILTRYQYFRAIYAVIDELEK